MLHIAALEGHGLREREREVRQLVGSNEGTSQKTKEGSSEGEAHEGTCLAPSRGTRERVHADQRNESRNKGRKRKGGTSKRHQKANFNKREASQLRKANEKPRPAPSLVFDVFSPAQS